MVLWRGKPYTVEGGASTVVPVLWCPTHEPKMWQLYLVFYSDDQVSDFLGQNMVENADNFSVLLEELGIFIGDAQLWQAQPTALLKRGLIFCMAMSTYCSNKI